MAKTVTGVTENQVKVPNKNGCTNLGCMTLDGVSAWALKTKDKTGEDKLSTLYYYTDFKTNKNPEEYIYPVFKNKFGHGNSMSSSKNYLYFVSKKTSDGYCKNAIHRMSKKPLYQKNPLETFTCKAYKAIAYKSGSSFIATNANNSTFTEYLKYSIVKLNTNTYTADVTSEFYVKNDIGGASAHMQDIYYDSQESQLFLTFNFKINDKLINNKIAVVDMSTKAGTYNGLDYYNMKTIVVVNKKESEYSKYEIESMALAPSRKIALVCNIGLNGASKESDGFQRITNLKF